MQNVSDQQEHEGEQENESNRGDDRHLRRIDPPATMSLPVSGLPAVQDGSTSARPRLLAGPCAAPQPVRFRRRGRPALRRPRVQIRPAIAHPVAEAVEGRPAPAHPVAVQRAGREAEIGRRTPGIEESALVAAHATRPFERPMRPACRAAGPAPTRDHAGRCRSQPAATHAGTANVGGAAGERAFSKRAVRSNLATPRRSRHGVRSSATARPPSATGKAANQVGGRGVSVRPNRDGPFPFAGGARSLLQNRADGHRPDIRSAAEQRTNGKPKTPKTSAGGDH